MKNHALTVIKKWEDHISHDEEQFIKECFPDLESGLEDIVHISFNSENIKIVCLMYGDEPMISAPTPIEKFLTYYNKTKWNKFLTPQEN